MEKLFHCVAYYPEPVSYTHLDVYKRQVSGAATSAIIYNVVIARNISSSLIAVSYTHLLTIISGIWKCG